MKKFTYMRLVLAAALAVTAVSCLREDPFHRTNNGPSAMDSMSALSSNGAVAGQANQLAIDLYAPVFDPGTKASSAELPDVKCEVKMLSYKKGENPMMPEDRAIGSQAATKSVYDQTTTRSLTANFLRLDENIGEGNTATYTFNEWNTAKVLEASVIATPDNTPNYYYRSITFSPTQAYNVYTFGEPDAEGHPSDTIFYHTRMIGWYPMNCNLPRVDGKPVVTTFNNALFASQRAEFVGADDQIHYGVSFSGLLDGKTDLMMSNMGEAQRWHPSDKTYYTDPAKTSQDIHYCEPFGHNEVAPTYANPLFFHHYLTAVRIFAMVDQSGDTAPLNMMTWGQMQALSFVDQPSSVVIGFPEQVSKYEGDEDALIAAHAFGVPQRWEDPVNFHAATDYMFGENDINHNQNDYTVVYPVDMTRSTTTMEKTYLGYCLVKPGEDVAIALQTAAGTYRALISHIYEYKDENNVTQTIDIFQPSQMYDITLNLKTKGTLADYIEQEDNDYYRDLSPYSSKSGFQTANCYRIDTKWVADTLLDNHSISERAGYCFIANIIGNGDSGILDSKYHTSASTLLSGSNAKLIWESQKGLVTNIQFQHGYVRFQLGDQLIENTPSNTLPEDYEQNITKGNAVIGVVDNVGNVVWSWHIWITDVANDMYKGDIQFSAGQVMDRNLGATSANRVDGLQTYGLYYQWGRKDPLPGPATATQDNGTSTIATVYTNHGETVSDLGLYVIDNGYTLDQGIQFPMYAIYNPYSQFYQFDWIGTPVNTLWGVEQDGEVLKSIYDPCPFGYRVPRNEINTIVTSATTRTSYASAAAGYGLSVSDGTHTTFLPYAGYKGPDRNASNASPVVNYTGAKGDYQGSAISSAEGYMNSHRIRTYISSATSWTEENMDGQDNFTYTATNHYVSDYTNRKTAASVRCVKDSGAQFFVTTSISASKTRIEGNEHVSLTLNAQAHPGTVTKATLSVSYKIGGVEQGGLLQTWTGNWPSSGQLVYDWAGLSASTLAQIDGKKITFTFYAEDTDPTVSSSSEVSVFSKRSPKIALYETATSGFTKFVSVSDNFSGDGNPVIGQPVTLAAYVCADDYDILTVTIGGVAASKTAEYKTIDGDLYYKYQTAANALLAQTTAGNQTLQVKAVESGTDGATVTKNGTMKVYGLEIGAATNVINSGNHYLIKSTQYNNYLHANSSTSAFVTTKNPTYFSIFDFSNSRTFNNGNTQTETIKNHGLSSINGASYYIYSDNTTPTLTTSSRNWTTAYTSSGSYYRFYYDRGTSTNRYLYVQDNNGTVARYRSGNVTDETSTRFQIYEVSVASAGTINITSIALSGGNMAKSGGNPHIAEAVTVTVTATVTGAENVTWGSATIAGSAVTGHNIVNNNNGTYTVTATRNVTFDTPGNGQNIPVSLTLNLDGNNKTKAGSTTVNVWGYKKVKTLTELTSTANITTNNVVIKNVGSGTYLVNNNHAFAFVSEANLNLDNDAHQWNVFKQSNSDSYYYVESVSDSYRFRSQSNGNFNLTTSTSNTAMTIAYVNANTSFTIRGYSSNYYMTRNNNDTVSGQKNVTTNSSRWKIYSITLTEDHNNYEAPTD